MTNTELAAIPSEKVCLVSKKRNTVFTYKEYLFTTHNNTGNWGFSILSPDPTKVQGIHTGNGHACYMDAKKAAVKYIDSLVRAFQ